MILAKTYKGLRNQEQKLNDKITILNLAMDHLRIRGLNDDRLCADDRFENPDDQRVYNICYSDLVKLQDKRARVRGQLRKKFNDDKSVEACRDLYAFVRDTIHRYF